MDDVYRALLKRGIRGGGAHLDPASVFDGLEYRFTGLYPAAIPNTIWQIAQHMHLWVQLKVDLFEGRDILFPEGHGFSHETAPVSETFWEQFKLDWTAALGKIEFMVDSLDLTARYPVWDNLTAAEIVAMMISHNGYHAAQIVAMRRLLGVWRSRD